MLPDLESSLGLASSFVFGLCHLIVESITLCAEFLWILNPMFLAPLAGGPEVFAAKPIFTNGTLGLHRKRLLRCDVTEGGAHGQCFRRGLQP